jgi:hypothetical protein
MFDDFGPHVFKTTDFGQSWRRIADNLPEEAYVHVLKEDPKNTDLVYAGTELGLYASYEGGGEWMRLHLKNLPTVAVHDIIIHPRENDIILGSHGRGLWVFDDATPLQNLAPEVLDKAVHLFDVRPGLRFRSADTVYGFGEKAFRAPNPPYGALITYHLKGKPEEDTPFTIEIRDLLSNVNDALKGLDSVKAQLTDRKQLLKSRKAGEELISAIESEIENLDELSEGIEKPAEKRYWATGPKVVERLGELFWGLNFINAAPTGPQLELLAELRGEANSAMDSIRQFMVENVSGLNAKLQEDGYPEISVNPK